MDDLQLMAMAIGERLSIKMVDGRLFGEKAWAENTIALLNRSEVANVRWIAVRNDKICVGEGWHTIVEFEWEEIDEALAARFNLTASRPQPSPPSGL